MDETPKKGTCQLLKRPHGCKGGPEKEKSPYGCSYFAWVLHSSERVCRFWRLSTVTHSVLTSRSQLPRVNVLEGQRGAPWLLKSHMLFAFQRKTRTLAGNSRYMTASRRYFQCPARGYFGLTKCSIVAIYPWVSFTSTVFIYTHTTIAPSVTTSIILNATAFVVLSKTQEPAPVRGRLSSDDGSISQRTQEFLACSHLETEQKGGDGAQKGKSQRHPHKGLVALPRQLKMFYKESSRFIGNLEIYECQELLILTRQSC